jgi:hypothetical protein
MNLSKHGIKPDKQQYTISTIMNNYKHHRVSSCTPMYMAFRNLGWAHHRGGFQDALPHFRSKYTNKQTNKQVEHRQQIVRNIVQKSSNICNNHQKRVQHRQHNCKHRSQKRVYTVKTHVNNRQTKWSTIVRHDETTSNNMQTRLPK